MLTEQGILEDFLESTESDIELGAIIEKLRKYSLEHKLLEPILFYQLIAEINIKSTHTRLEGLVLVAINIIEVSKVINSIYRRF